MPNEKVLIAAGGTGGHIYPALAMAEALRRVRPDMGVEFVGTAHGLENRLVPAAGYRVHHLPIGRLNANVPVLERVKTLLQMPLALVKSFAILRRVRPAFVLGVGGHATGPMLLISALCGYRTGIWEPNAMPGLANRWLARFVDECWVVFEEAKALLKNRNSHHAGMPVRREIEQVTPVPPGPRFRVLVFGGSQGARSLNTAVAELLSGADEAWLSGVRFVHQTGATDFARVKSLYGGRTLPVDVREYLNDMGEQYANADLVISRSGTGTLSELAACGKPAILVPLPTAADDHQRKNAESLVRRGAAVMVLNSDLSAARLRAVVDELRADPHRLEAMSRSIREFHQPHAADNLVQQFLERIEHAPG